MEEWKDIKGFEGLYQISNYGRIKSFYGKEKILNGGTDRDGYKIIKLVKNKKYYPKKIHRLVAEAFLPNPYNLPEINHKDEIPCNNKVENLEWCTHKYNLNYGNHNKKLSENKKQNYKRSDNPNSKKILCITTQEIFNCIIDAEEQYNIAHQSISKCCKGKYKSAGKHPITGEKMIWRYL